MLIDEVIAQRTGIRLGTPSYNVMYDDMLAPLRRRLASTQVYVMDRDAIAMAANVSLSKPSSILAALPWVKLPAESVWIECVPDDIRTAMTDLGSPNVMPPDRAGHLKRVGFLFTPHPKGIAFEYVHAMQTDMGVLVELSSLRGIYDLRTGEAPTVEAALKVRKEDSARGRVRQHLDLIATDPAEHAANQEILDRLEWEGHPDMLPALKAYEAMKGPRAVPEIHAGWISEARRLFVVMALPGLILLNTRNAVDISAGPSMEKVNKNRIRSGKPPLVEHLVVKMKLSPNQSKRAARDGDGGRTIRGSLVIGHFKIRQTGIFWWGMHSRRGYGAVIRTTVLTR